MTWQVTSRISGGPTLSVPDAQQFQALIASLEQASRRMTLQARLWSEARERIVSSQLQSGCCPANRQISPGSHSNAINAFRHIPLRHRELSHWCDEQTRDCHAVAVRLDTLSRLVARAHGLYLDAEHRASSYGGSIPTDPLATSAPSLKGLPPRSSNPSDRYAQAATRGRRRLKHCIPLPPIMRPSWRGSARWSSAA